MERGREGCHRKNKTYRQDVFSGCIPGRLKLLDVTFIKSHNTCNGQVASSIVFGCYPQVLGQLAPRKILKNYYYYYYYYY